MMRNKRIVKKFFNCFFCAVAFQLFAIATPGATSTETGAEYSALAEQFDWIVTVDGQNFEKFLDYPTSQLCSMNKFIVSYRQTGSSLMIRGSQLPVYHYKNFEEFWYHDGHPIGQRRSCAVPSPETEQGAIVLHPQKNADNFTRSAANCLVRIFLEARLAQSIVAAVIVPQDQFEKISTEFGQFNFLEVQATTTQREGNVTFRLLSDPPGYEKHFYYVDHQ